MGGVQTVEKKREIRIMDLDNKNRITHVSFNCGHSNYAMHPKLKYRIFWFIRRWTYYKVKAIFRKRRDKKIIEKYFRWLNELD